jgi:hypothetical protein
LASDLIKNHSKQNGKKKAAPLRECGSRGCFYVMQKAAFYREQAERARRLARSITNGEAERMLPGMAQEYDDLATDLERGAVEIRHPELLTARQRSGGA